MEATVIGRFEVMLVPSKEPQLSLTVSRVGDVVPGQPVLGLLGNPK
jgi:hypothetical protein